MLPGRRFMRRPARFGTTPHGQPRRSLTPVHGVEIILGLLLAVAALAWLASRLKISYPIFLVLGGLALGFVPHLPRVHLQPDVVFLVFLPPVLYYAALLTSWRDFKANLRPIGLLAIGLVLFTTCL